MLIFQTTENFSPEGSKPNTDNFDAIKAMPLINIIDIFIINVEMSYASKQFFSLTSSQQVLHPVSQLEGTLVHPKPLPPSITQMQQMFMDNKILNKIIKEQKQKQKQLKQTLNKTQKRIIQIKHLDDVVGKQTAIVQKQTEKIRDALTLNRILMMQRVVRLQREAQQLNNRRQICNKIRRQRNLSEEVKKLRFQQKLKSIKLQTLTNTINIRHQLDQVRCNTMQMKRNQANQIKIQHERQRTRSRKIHSYKQIRARTNYLSKISQLQEDITQKQEALQEMAKLSNQQMVRAQATKKVAREYFNSFFATEATTL